MLCTACQQYPGIPHTPHLSTSIKKSLSNLTLYFHLRSLKHRPRKCLWRAVRGRLWLDHAVWLSGLTDKDFDRAHVQRGRAVSNLMLKWRAGEVLPSRASAIALEKQLPGTLWAFDLPLFPLLEDRTLARREIHQATKSWRVAKRHPVDPDWRLPPDSQGRTVYASIDTASLVARGDVWGLAGIVASARMAELAHDEIWHSLAMMDAFRALPALYRAPWSQEAIRPLFELLVDQQARMAYSRLTFTASLETIETLARTEDYEPDPQLRDAKPGRAYSMFPDPIISLITVQSRKVNFW